MPSGKDTQTGNPIYGVSVADKSIDNTKLADGSISTTKIMNQSITTVKLADAVITASKLAPGAVGATAVVGTFGSTAIAANPNFTGIPTANSHPFALSAGTSGRNPLLIFGRVLSTAAIQYGSFFGVSHIGSGAYYISFSPAFTNGPAVIVAPGFAGVARVDDVTVTAAGCEIETTTFAGVNVDGTFHFMALGD